MQPPGREPAPARPEEILGGRPAAGDESPAQAARRRARIAGRYEDFLRSTVDWLWEAGPDLKLTYVSSPVALNLGIPAQVLVGRPLLGLGRFQAAGDPEQRAQAAIRDRRPFRNAIFVMTGAGERRVPYRLSGVPYFDDETGDFAGFRGTAVALPPEPEAPVAAEDEVRALAATLEEALLRNQDLAWRLSQGQPAAEAAPAPRGPDLARTAHELRTPLNAIVGYADLGLKQIFGPIGERYLDCFRTIREAGRHLDELVVQMREAGKRAGRVPLAAEVVDVAAIAAKAKAIIALAAKDADIDISRVGPMAGGRVVADRLACTQILVNLLTNAVKFTPAGGSVGLESLVGPDGRLQIVVWDTGIGIPQAEQAKIFEPDYRAEAVRALRELPGHGLGLAISRELARAMGGELSVASQPGQGSRFILSLPLAAEPPAAEA